jgi:predicted RNA polymerase sigma factor
MIRERLRRFGTKWRHFCVSVEQPIPEQEREEDRLADTYEASLMEHIDDTVLRMVFVGVVNGRK